MHMHQLDEDVRLVVMEGQRANLDRKQIDENPYFRPHPSWKHVAWTTGWCQSQLKKEIGAITKQLEGLEQKPRDGESPFF